MSQQQWTAVDDYITGTLVESDDALDAALRGQRGGRTAGDRRLARAGQAAQPARQDDRARAGSSRSARSAGTARSGWPGRCRRTAA